MAKELIRLTDDLDKLFPGDEVTIGTQKIPIKPLGVGKLASISRKLKKFGESLGKEGITWDNYNEKKHVIMIATRLLEEFPDTLQDATNIHMDDLVELPIEVIVELLVVVVNVNLASKESMEKNFKSLAERFQITTKKKDTPRRKR